MDKLKAGALKIEDGKETSYNSDSRMVIANITCPLKQTMVQAPSLLSGSVIRSLFAHALNCC